MPPEWALPDGLRAGDEGRHPPGPEAGWQETWSFRFWTRDGGIGGLTSLTFHPRLGRSWYWAVLVRAGAPLLHVTEMDGPLPPAGLLVKSPGIWAEHTCEAAFEQWTVVNETYAVALDDPAEALGRGYGLQTPIAFDLEWYAVAPPLPVGSVLGVRRGEVHGYEQRGGRRDELHGYEQRGERRDEVHGYEQQGEVHGVVELAGGPLELDGIPADRIHHWGPLDWFAPSLGAPPAAAGSLDAPVLLTSADGRRAAAHHRLTTDGWSSWTEPLA